MDNAQEKAPQVGMWAIVELFGHQRIAGFMTEQVIAGQGFVRVDVPEVLEVAGSIRESRIAPHTRMFGAGAIYAINPVDEHLARLAAQQIRHAPISSYGLAEILRNMTADQRQRLLTEEPF